MKRKKISLPPHGIRYKNLLLTLLSILLSALLISHKEFHAFLLHLGSLEYVGAFFAGMFWVSTFTIAPASIVLFILSRELPIWLVALFGGLGAVFGDTSIFHFVRSSDISRELLDLFHDLGGRKITHLFYSRHLRWTWPFIGALIIISPLPDEIGVSLMGISKMNYWYFACISFVLNTLGILLLLGITSVVK